jgi:hypothetical protein
MRHHRNLGDRIINIFFIDIIIINRITGCLRMGNRGRNLVDLYGRWFIRIDLCIDSEIR